METNLAVEARTRGAVAPDCSILIAVQPQSFQRLIEHLLHGHAGLRIVGHEARGNSALAQAARLAPDVIIASTRLHGRERHGDVLAALKRSSPASTLILLTHGLDEHALQSEVDAWLPEDAIVKRLLPVIRKVVDRTRERALQSTSTGRRS